MTDWQLVGPAVDGNRSSCIIKQLAIGTAIYSNLSRPENIYLSDPYTQSKCLWQIGFQGFGHARFVEIFKQRE